MIAASPLKFSKGGNSISWENHIKCFSKFHMSRKFSI